MKRNVFSYKIDHFVEKRDGCSSGGAKSLGRQWTEESLIGSRNGHSQGALSAPGRAEGAAAFGAQRARPRSGLPQTSTVRPGPSVDGGFSRTAAPRPCVRPRLPAACWASGGRGGKGVMELVLSVKKRWAQKESGPAPRQHPHGTQITRSRPGARRRARRELGSR